MARIDRRATRVLELSLFPELRPPRYVGPIVQSVQRGTNSELIALVAPLYLTGSVLDVTYGRGGWWHAFKPEPFAFHDLQLDGVDFRALPEDDDSFDAVCFDPPYIHPGGSEHAAHINREFRARYGLTPGVNPDSLMADGLPEVARVARRWVLVKCCDAVNGGKFWIGHFHAIALALELGLTPHDVIVHNPGSGPGGHNIAAPIRTRRSHSYLLVFEKKEQKQ